MRRLRQLGRSRGQALVELALALPVLLLIFMGLFDFGRAVFAYNSLSNAAREGARVAIVDQTIVAGVPVGATEAASQATGLGLDPSDTAQVQVSYLMPDLSASLDVELARAPGALVVPLDAVRQDGDRAFVSVQRGSSFEERQVTLGAKSAHEVVVAAGIDAGAVLARNVARGTR